MQPNQYPHTKLLRKEIFHYRVDYLKDTFTRLHSQGENIHHLVAYTELTFRLEMLGTRQEKGTA